MNFLADENLESSVVSYLKEKNITILAVRDFLKGSADAEILDYALKNKLVLITNDKDFGELTIRLHKPDAGIILLRLPELTSEEKKFYC
jgi:predicted nuclease of predicted toxin-antitoxin system